MNRTWVNNIHNPQARLSKYQWPADQLTKKEMAILHGWRRKTQTPINYLLAQAIELMDKIIKGGGINDTD